MRANESRERLIDVASSRVRGLLLSSCAALVRRWLSFPCFFRCFLGLPAI